ncbi:MAG TPA: hypothetical protein VJ724_03715 [Tahibacter sp.]|nr:hypothetical protein [Tahibacter sp.]
MGLAFSWIAAIGAPAQALAALKLEDTGEPAQPGEAELVGAALPGGGYVVVANAFGHAIADDPALREASRTVAFVGCAEYATVNASIAFAWRGGARVWQAAHVLDEGATHLDVDGDAPPEVARMLDRAIARHRAEGHDAVFDVPAQLAQLRSGYRYGDKLRYTRLKPRMTTAEVGTTTLAFDWPTCREDFGPILSRALVAALGRHGFVAKSDCYPWSAEVAETIGDMAVTVFAGAYDHGPDAYTVGVLVFVLHESTDRLIREAMPTYSAQPTWTVSLAKDAGLGAFLVEDAADLAKLLEYIAAKLPPFVGRCLDLRELDRLVNGDRAEIRGTEFLSSEGPIALAYLAGNPNFESMVAYAESRYDLTGHTGLTPTGRLVELLRSRERRLPPR